MVIIFNMIISTTTIHIIIFIVIITINNITIIIINSIFNIKYQLPRQQKWRAHFPTFRRGIESFHIT